MNMMVKSPAGESIEIWDDERWMKHTGTPSQSLSMWTKAKPVIIRALWEHGEFTNSSGFAIKAVLDYAGGYKVSASAISSLMGSSPNAPAFTREIRGKKTFSVKLVALPDRWYQKLLADIAADPLAQPPEPEAPQGIPEPSAGDRAAAEQMEAIIMPQDWSDADWEALKMDAPTIYEEPPPIELHIANQVAMSLLTTVVEIISAGSADTTRLTAAQQIQRELEQVQHNLAIALGDGNKLRKQLREAGDSIIALRTERDGLRTRLRATEHNLNEALKGETAQAVNSEITKRIDQIMRTTPTAKGE